MPKTLVIVESPTKAKTLERYLGGDYTVRPRGHIRDLPEDSSAWTSSTTSRPTTWSPRSPSGTSGS